jgi:hypothetical protein
VDDSDLAERLAGLGERLEQVLERFMDARDELTALIESDSQDRRARQLARDRLLDRAIDIEAAATEIEQLLRRSRDA